MPFRTGGAAGAGTLSDLEIDTDKDWKGYSILNFVADLGDDQKIFLGADDDYSLRYDSADDTFYIRDEVNATEVEIPKNVAMNLAAHEARHESGGADAIPEGSLNPQDPTAHATSHESGGADELFDQNLNTTNDVQFSQVTVADLVMDNDWRFTEHPDHGVVLKSPEGRIFKLIVEELK